MLQVSDYTDVFRELLPYGLKELVYEDCPSVGWMPKDGNFGSDAIGVSARISGVRGSNQFTTGKANKGVPVFKRFLVTRVRSYVLASIDRETMMAAANDKYAEARALDQLAKSATYEMSKAMGTQLHQEGGGWRGRGDGAWTVSGTTITFEDASQAFNFELDDYIVASDDDGTTAGASPRAGRMQVKEVDVEAGTIELYNAANDASDGIPAIANDDYLFREGDFGNCLAGFPGWIPETVGSSDSWFNVNRSIHRLRLAGLFYDGAGDMKEKTVLRAASRLRRYGAPTGDYVLVCHPEDETELIAGAYAKAELDVKTDIPTLMYKTVAISTALGKVPVLCDPYCRKGRAYLLKRSTWRFAHLGELPGWVMDGNDKLITEPTADGWEIRQVYYGNIICDDPSKNAHIKW